MMVKNRILLLIILCFLIFIDQRIAMASSRSYNSFFPNNLATSTGTVEGVARNSIEIYDELQKSIGRFIYLDRAQEFHQGDYVRVYYYPTTKVAQKIKRMTIVEYKINGQNLGYISK